MKAHFGVRKIQGSITIIYMEVEIIIFWCQYISVRNNFDEQKNVLSDETLSRKQFITHVTTLLVQI